MKVADKEEGQEEDEDAANDSPFDSVGISRPPPIGSAIVILIGGCGRLT